MVRSPLLLALVGSMVLCFVTHPAGADGFRKKVNRKLVGTWKVESAERDGKEVSGAIKGAPWVMTATTFTARLPREGEGEGKFAYELGQAGKLGTIDISVIESQWADLGPRKRVYRGIYLLEGENLKVCYGRPYGSEKDRPTTFDAKAGSGRSLFLLKRVAGGQRDR
jgi:uncharacterized protein (TIGR03067 family)